MARAYRVGVICGGRFISRKTQPQKLTVLLSFLFSVSLSSSVVFGLEAPGHKAVAQMMLPLLSETSVIELERLFGQRWRTELVNLAVEEQARVSRAASELDLARQVTFFDVEQTEFSVAQNCPGNACSVAVVLESRQVFLDDDFSDFDKRKAIGYSLHYIVQLHLPLNNGLRSDHGGADIELKDANLALTSLQAVWQSGMFEYADQTWFGYAQRQSRKLKTMDVSAWQADALPQQWAFESHRVALEQVYPFAQSGRFGANLKVNGRRILDDQLMKAAVRSAVFLNEVLLKVEQED